MSQDWFQDIKDFHKKFGHVSNLHPTIEVEDKVKLLRLRLIDEEVQEAKDAMHHNDLVELADGIADAIVVLLGTAVTYGIDMRPIWDEVHRSNMSKSHLKDAAGKTLKPEGWRPPDVDKEITKQLGGK